MYKDGLIGGKRDIDKAKEKFEEAEKLGDLLASTSLGKLYYDKNNFSKAKEYFEKAKETEPIAYYYLGLIYQNGDEKDAKSEKKGVEKNLKMAIKCFSKAAELDCHQAENSLGQIYEEGNGVKQDLKKTEEYYSSASSHGSKVARDNIERLKKTMSDK